MSILQSFEGRLALWWSVLRDFVQVLKPCRFSALVIVAAGLLLISDQGQELTRRLGGEGASLREAILFFVCVFLWAFQSWYFARLILDAIFGLQREVQFPDDAARQKRVKWTIEHLPRLLALAAFLVAAGALAFSSAWMLAAATVVLGGVFYFVLVRRQRWTKEYIAGRFGRFFLPRAGIERYERLKDLPAVSRVVLGISLAIAIAATAWVIADPVAFGAWFGSPAAAFFGFSCIVPVGSLLVFWSHRGGASAAGHQLGWESSQESYPIIMLLLVLAVIFGIWVDNHDVRLARAPDSAAAIPVEGRPTLEEAIDAWYGRLPETARNSPDGAPLIIVATAGGGSRAAYWTATVLGALQDANSDFSRYVFGISGVSGGTLGATVYRTLLAVPMEAWPKSVKECGEDIQGVARGAFECAGQQVLSQDFLGPLIGALLFPDLLQRFIPVSVMPDRAQALEKSWEHAWLRTGFPADTWQRRRFNSLFTDAADPRGSTFPALFLNGTHVDTGKRVITSNVQIDNSRFLDAYDFFNLVDGDVWVATAALNSARFPYVAPAGTMRRGGESMGRIVDGGYFENFGALTALQLMRGVREILAAKGMHAQPIFIQISSDPDLSDTDLPDSPAKVPATKAGAHYLNEALSPIRAFLGTRTARGVLAAKQLFEKEPGLKYPPVHFRLCRTKGQRDPALGWVLSRSAEQNIREGLHLACDNDAAFQRLGGILASYPASAPAK